MIKSIKVRLQPNNSQSYFNTLGVHDLLTIGQSAENGKIINVETNFYRTMN